MANPCPSHRNILLSSTVPGTTLCFVTPAAAQDTAASAESDSPEIVVTANRRAQDVIDNPYNVSANSSDQLNRTGVSSVADLSYQVPNFVVQDQGARHAASAVPIIRGLMLPLPSRGA